MFDPQTTKILDGIASRYGLDTGMFREMSLVVQRFKALHGRKPSAEEMQQIHRTGKLPLPRKSPPSGLGGLGGNALSGAGGMSSRNSLSQMAATGVNDNSRLVGRPGAQTSPDPQVMQSPRMVDLPSVAGGYMNPTDHLPPPPSDNSNGRPWWRFR